MTFWKDWRIEIASQFSVANILETGRPYEWVVDGRLPAKGLFELLVAPSWEFAAQFSPGRIGGHAPHARHSPRWLYFNGYVTSGAWENYPWARFQHDVDVMRATDNKVCHMGKSQQSGGAAP